LAQGANAPTWNSMSGDVTISSSGVTAIGSSKVTNAMLAGSIDAATKFTGLTPIANGGTNSSATATAGGIGYGTGTAHAYTSAGTSGQHIISAGASAPLLLTSGFFDLLNCSITASVASNAMTVALKDASGNDPSSTSPCYISFRSATAATGTTSTVAVTGALSVVIPSTATMGTISTIESKINVGVINNAGTVELVVSNMGATTTDGRISSTTISGSASSASVFYSTTGRSNVAYRLLGAIVSTQTTAGTWAASPTAILLKGSGIDFVPAKTNPVAYTPTFTGFGTVGGINVTSYRDGAYLIIDGAFSSGTVTATEARITIGFNGSSANVTTVSTLPTLSIAGFMNGGSTSTTQFGIGNTLMEASKTYITTVQNSSTNSFAKSQGTVWGSTQTFGFTAKVPIQGWFASDWQ
jgi:hypothetical protein